MTSLLRFRGIAPSCQLRLARSSSRLSAPSQPHPQPPTATSYIASSATMRCQDTRQLHQSNFASASRTSRGAPSSPSARPDRQPLARSSAPQSQQQPPASPLISSPAFDPAQMVESRAAEQQQRFLPPRHVFSYNVERDYDGDLLRAGNDWVQSSKNTSLDWQMKYHVRAVSKLARQEVPTTIRQRQVRQGKRRAKDNELLTMMRATLYKKILGRLI